MWKSVRQLATMSAVAAALPTAILATPVQQTDGGRGQLQSTAIERFAGQIAEDVARDDIGGITAGVFVGGRDGTVSTDRPAREHWGRGYKVPNGGIYSTVRDLARFAAGITGASAVEILPPEWRVETMRIQTPDSSTAGYGLGFSIRTTESGLRTVGHGGSVAGYNAHLVFDPETTVGVVLLRNYNRGSTNLARRAVALLEELVQEGVERLTR